MMRLVLVSLLAVPAAAPAEPTTPGELAARLDLEILRLCRQVSDPVDDGLFLRRAMLDLVGRPPTAGETKTFLADEDPEKRANAVDRMLGTHAFANHWARRLSEVLLGDTRTFRTDLALASNLRERMAGDFICWLTGRIRDDRPWGEIVREMVSARGTSDRHPELAWKLSFFRGKEPALEFATR